MKHQKTPQQVVEDSLGEKDHGHHKKCECPTCIPGKSHKIEVEFQKNKVSINEMAFIVHENAVRKGFHPPDQPLIDFVSNQVNNMHGELTELWDAWRAGKQNELCDKPSTGLSCTAEELADIIIRALDVSYRLGINIQNAIEAKHSYNLTRPHKHGKLN